MRVKITKANEDNWYKVGEEYDVCPTPLIGRTFGEKYYPLVDDERAGIGEGDFVALDAVYDVHHTEASRLAARIEAANAMAANIPEKTLWDEYAMAALAGLLANGSDGYLANNVQDAVSYANLMMEARKNK